MKIVIVGLGVIGGSYAMALKNAGYEDVYGIDTNTETLRKAKEMGIIKEGYVEGKEVIREADIIILDEFHHCGAPEWGKAVEQLIKNNPNAKILGLSATPMRYFDGETRDMAEELFDNNVASEMSLAEAIATGVLSEPDYTTGLYEYDEIIKELEEKWQKLSDSEKERNAQEYQESMQQFRSCGSVGQVQREGLC